MLEWALNGQNTHNNVVTRYTVPKWYSLKDWSYEM